MSNNISRGSHDLAIHSVSLSDPKVQVLVSELDAFLEEMDAQFFPDSASKSNPASSNISAPSSIGEVSLGTVGPETEGLTDFSTSPPNGGFFLATVGPEKTPAGIVALRTIHLPVEKSSEQQLEKSINSGAKFGEVKRMFVRPGFRGKGIAKGLLEALETRAKDLKMESLLLETGFFQTDAISLYEKVGWKRRSLYGEYVGNGVEDGGISICFEKKLP